jgi:hypothetical protein
MSTKPVNVQFHCDRCAETVWYEMFLPTSNQNTLGIPISGSGLMKKSINHGDHVVIADIDYNGAIRTAQIVDIHFTPIETLIADITQGFYFYMQQSHKPLYIDVYSTNSKLVAFFQKLISQLFETAIGNYNGIDQIIASTVQGNTRLYSERIQISVGTTILEDALPINSIKGIILDITEVENNRPEIESTLDMFDWCIVLLQKENYEGYEAAFESFFKVKRKPFFIDVLNNKTMIKLFEFIFSNLFNY